MSEVIVYKCDDCGCLVENLDIDSDVSFDYSEIIRTGEPQEVVKGGWRWIGRQYPEDPIVVEVEHYCTDCEEDNAL